MRVDAALAHHLRKRVVERLERPPTPVHEVEPSGMQVAAGGHARETADEVGIEGDGPSGEAVKVRCLDAVGAVAAQGRAVQRVEQDKNGSHNCASMIPLNYGRNNKRRKADIQRSAAGSIDCPGQSRVFRYGGASPPYRRAASRVRPVPTDPKVSPSITLALGAAAFTAVLT